MRMVVLLISMYAFEDKELSGQIMVGNSLRKREDLIHRSRSVVTNKSGQVRSGQVFLFNLGNL